MDLSQFNLPQSVRDRVELTPMEDVALAVFRDAMPDVKFRTMIPYEQQSLFETGEFVLIRRAPELGYWLGHESLLDEGVLLVNVFTQGHDADTRGALISEAIRVTLRDSWRNQHYYPGIGCINFVRVLAAPTRKTDWQASTGPVQFADLPTGTYRYESQYRLRVRPPLWG